MYCSSPDDTHLKDSDGIISSHVTDETGCGSTRSPWVIAAMPGQTIELSIIDFGSETYKREINTTSMVPVYGHIADGPDKVTFGGSVTRKRELLRSKTHHVSIDILPTSQRNENGFLIQYKSKTRYDKTLCTFKCWIQYYPSLTEEFIYFETRDAISQSVN